MFRVGQKVVCIKEGQWSHEGVATYVGDPCRKGDVLTIDKIEMWADGVWLTFIEKRLYCLDAGGEEVFYLASRFRPLVTRKTDISIFTRILDDVNRKQQVRA